VSPGYFETLGIKLVAGRTFGPGDETGAPPVAIVNEAFVRRYFPDQNPVGQRVEVGRFRGEYLHPELEGPGAEIVAVVADVREVSLRAEASRTVFVPASQSKSLCATPEEEAVIPVTVPDRLALLQLEPSKEYCA